MARNTEEITAVFRAEKVRKDDWLVAVCDPVPVEGQLFDDAEPSFEMKTTASEGELVQGLTYRLYGRWTYSHQYGRQFDAKTFVRSTPHGQTGTVRYLMQAPHIGQATAQKLWEKFAGDAVRILREQPDVASAAVGGQFNDANATAASEFLKREQALESCTIDLIDLLGGRGFPKETAKKAIGAWGNRAADFIKKNPFRLMRFRGCGFNLCDRMYMDLGHNPQRLKRQALCAWYVLASDVEGDTWQSREAFTKAFKARVGGRCDVQRAVVLAKRGGLIETRRDEAGELWVAEGKRAKNERDIADRIKLLSGASVQWPSVAGLDVSDHQRNELIKSLQGPIGCLAGSPGTGKTYSLARLVAEIKRQHGADSIAVAAPTGKAARRIAEGMASYGIADVDVGTIHQLLGVKAHDDRGGWAFEHGPDNPLPFRFVAVDESSMVDADLMAALLRACVVGTHVLFVGDPHQLLPVGHGAPFRDLIAAGLPSGKLTEIRRNAGTIVKTCAAIRDEHSFELDRRINPATGENLQLLPVADAAVAKDRVLNLLRKLRDGGRADPIWECQVICAVNEKSPLGRQELNKLLQTELNPRGRGEVGLKFRENDKVICLKNGSYALCDAEAEKTAGETYLANGEIGRVLAVDPRGVVIRFETPERVVRVFRGKDEGDGEVDAEGNSNGGGLSRFDLAYAVSCHKSQGSEWPVVIVVLDEYPGARLVCSRNWVYTAISRARTACFLVGKLSTLKSMCRRDVLWKRKTFLRELLSSESM